MFHIFFQPGLQVTKLILIYILLQEADYFNSSMLYFSDIPMFVYIIHDYLFRSTYAIFKNLKEKSNS